jgi:serine/threonine-protein kinase
MRAYTYPRISPDGSRIALDLRDQDQDIHVWDVARAVLTRLTFDPGPDIAPVWSPDGKGIAYASAGRGVLLQPADGSGKAASLTEEKSSLYAPTMFTPDGTNVMLNDNQGSSNGIKMVSLTGKVTTILDEPSFNEHNGTLSPDGRWMVYQSNESGQYEIYVRPFPDVQAGRWQISSAGGTRPMWRGKEIVYLAASVTMAVTMMSVPVSTEKGFTYGNAVKLFSGPYFATLIGRTYDVSADGQKFLMIKPAAGVSGTGSVSRMIVVQNWMEDLRR